MSIQTIKATIQMRKGAEQNFDPSQMTAGEWAVSTDSKKVWMCFSSGIVRRMATYEAFEQDMLDIQTILATCRDIQAAVERFEQLAEQHASQAETWSITSKSWAIGGTGTREGEDTDNSKYYSEQSKSEANRAKNEADRAAAIAGIHIDSELSETSANPVQNKVIAKVLAKLKEVAFSGSYTDLSNKPTIIWKANTKINEGYVTKGEGNGNKIWGTDADGNPGWKENKFVSLSNNFLVTEAGISALDAAVGPIIQKNFDNTENEIAQINGKLSGFIGVINVATSQITVPATGGAAIDAQVNVPEGYSLVEVFPRSTTNMVWLTCDCYKTGAKTCKFSLYNHYSQNLPGTGYGYAIVVKK